MREPFVDALDRFLGLFTAADHKAQQAFPSLLAERVFVAVDDFHEPNHSSK